METLKSGQRYQLLHNTEEKNLQLSPGKLTAYQSENTTTPNKKTNNLQHNRIQSCWLAEKPGIRDPYSGKKKSVN